MTPDFTKYPEGLVPVIIQDYQTLEVLMLGYMNEAALAQTSSSGRVTFYSRSRKQLWTKGETSGNYLAVKEILPDCDRDCLLIKAEPAGPVCHTGAVTCFGKQHAPAHFLYTLERIIAQRAAQPAAGSYTASLLREGIGKIAQKVGEEAVELILEAKDDNRELFLNEAADLLFHLLVLLRAKDVSLAVVSAVLAGRHRPEQRG